jgi:CheY-like chemotaxis protein
MGREQLNILVADDDEDDRLLVVDAMAEVGSSSSVEMVEDGKALMDYLQKRTTRTLPDLILLDLNMPRKNGYECIEEIRADRDLSHVPIVVLTTSTSDREVRRAYRLGANSFVTKPVSFAKTVATLRGLFDYWDGVVQLPSYGFRD